jgi:chitodextrinase
MSRWLAALLVAAASTGCAMDKTKAPALGGPSDFGLSVDVRATPDVLERDGVSQSVIRVFARDASGKLTPGQRFLLSMSPTNGGTLSTGEVVTGPDGIATAVFPAAASNVNGPTVRVGATPISGANDSGNYDNSRTQSVSIAMRGASAATSTFVFSPEAPKQFDLVTFDASGTTLEGRPCEDSCTFRWTFGNEGTATGEVVTHRFENGGAHTVTLTVTGPGGITVTTRKAVTVTIAEPPEAKIVASSATPLPGAAVRFTGATSSAKGGAKVVSWEWDFGNGETASGMSVTTSFEEGTYVVVLTVRDSNGQEDSETQVITAKVPEVEEEEED